MSSVSCLSLDAERCNTLAEMVKHRAKKLPPLAQRLIKCRKERKWSQAKVGKELDVTRNAVSLWESGTSTPTPERLREAAVLFGKSYEWLSTGRGLEQERNATVEGLRLVGDIQAGVWREPTESQDMEFMRVPVAPVSDYPVEAQYALRIVGNSVDRIAKDGAIIHCIDVGMANLTPRDGDLVCAERIRGTLREMTVKRLRAVNGALELWPESTDPTQQEKLAYKPPKGNGEVIIRAIVIGAFQPIARGS
jgi:transcriptional regulator with XRE-family HTH domain